MDKSKRRFSGDNISTATTLHKSKRLRSSSITFFNEDIYTEILLRLPVKSLLKLQTVSKLWLSIVSSPQFRKNHASRPASATGLFFPIHKLTENYGLLPFNIDSQIKQPEIMFTNPFVKRPDDCKFMSFKCISSCNGLQLLKSPKSRESPDHIYYYVYNPTTYQYKELLGIPPYISQSKFVCASLAFDPHESFNFKVVFLWGDIFSDNFQLEVYSSSTGTWKAPATNTVVGHFRYAYNCGIFCNGAIHWLLGDAKLIVYFNVHTERIKQLRTPRLAHQIHYFGESQGRLYLVNTNGQYFYESSRLNVYELKEDYSGWSVKYLIHLASIASTLPKQVYQRVDHGTCMSIFRDAEDGNDLTMVLLTCNEWVKYNFKKKTTKRLCEFVLPELCGSHYPWDYGVRTHRFILGYCTSYFLWIYGFNTHQFIPTLLTFD